MSNTFLVKFVGRPLVFTVLAGKIIFLDRVTVEGGVVSIDHSVVTVDSNRTVIVRDRKGPDLPVQLSLPPHSFVELDNGPYGKRHAVSVLSVGDVKCGSATLDCDTPGVRLTVRGCTIANTSNCDERKTEVPDGMGRFRFQCRRGSVDKGYR